MRRFLPFAALLGVALVLGCQDVGTGPDGLVPQFDKKDLTRGEGDCPGDLDPINGHCHGDDGSAPEGDNVGVTLMGGIESAGQQLATLGADGAVLNVFTADRGFFAALHLQTDLSMCRTENELAGLAD